MIFFGSTALCTGAAFLRRGSRRLLPAPHRRYGRGGSGTDGCHEGIMDFLHGSPALLRRAAYSGSARDAFRLRSAVPDLPGDVGPLLRFSCSYPFGVLDSLCLSEVRRSLGAQLDQAASHVVALRSRKEPIVDRFKHRLVRLHLAIDIGLVESIAGEVRQLSEIARGVRSSITGLRLRGRNGREFSVERRIVHVDALCEVPCL